MKKMKKWGAMAGMVILFLLGNSELFAQSAPKGGRDGEGKSGLCNLEYDLADFSKPDNHQAVKNDGKLVVKITNVNRLVYDVNVTGKATPTIPKCQPCGRRICWKWMQSRFLHRTWNLGLRKRKRVSK